MWDVIGGIKAGSSVVGCCEYATDEGGGLTVWLLTVWCCFYDWMYVRYKSRILIMAAAEHQIMSAGLSNYNG